MSSEKIRPIKNYKDFRTLNFKNHFPTRTKFRAFANYMQKSVPEYIDHVDDFDWDIMFVFGDVKPENGLTPEQALKRNARTGDAFIRHVVKEVGKLKK